MEVFLVFNQLSIQSHKGIYNVFPYDDLSFLSDFSTIDYYFIIDSQVASIYESNLSTILSTDRYVLIEANEYSKSIEQIIPIINTLVNKNIKRQSTIVAIGGGIVQDISCFISSVLFRGINWIFVPTTLLAQADSCIGSKSSVNLMPFKNIIGNFYPPKQIYLSSHFLHTLSYKDICSGIGEIIKVHIIDSFESFNSLANDFSSLTTDYSILRKYIYKSLLIKKQYIEKDEFDTGIRNIFNYGHSFGHAIESATNFAIPHGVSVSIGIDLANYISLHYGFIDSSRYLSYQHILKSNYSTFLDIPIPLDAFFSSLSKDKKNTATQLCIILPKDNFSIDKFYLEATDDFRLACANFFSTIVS